jgi:hypothetical protein
MKKFISYAVAVALVLIGGAQAIAQEGMRLGYQHLELHEFDKPQACPKEGDCVPQGIVATVRLRKVPSAAEVRRERDRIAAKSDARVYTEARRGGGVNYIVVKP